MRILIVEDESPLRAQLVSALTQEGHSVEGAATGEEGYYLGAEYNFDLAIVDLGLPGLPGDRIIRQWRAAGRRFPILILTARGRWQDKVEGLEAGADDYLVKPFHLEELLARARALVRRASGWSRSPLRRGPLTIDTAAQKVTLDRRDVELTAYEYRLLEYLVLHAGEVLSKNELTDYLYAQDFERDSNVIEVFIGRLRRKLDPDNRYTLIETLRGRGYRFAQLSSDDK